MHSVLRLIAAFGVLLAVAACSTTETVKGAANSGYVPVRQVQGKNLYVCPPPECGSSAVFVAHQSKRFSASEIRELEVVTGPGGAELARSQLQFISALRGSTFAFGRGSVRKIGSFTATVIPISDSRDPRRKGSLVILANGDRGEFFVAVASNRSSAERAVIRFATLWAKEQ